MLTTRIIPCLDVSDNRVLKGVQFSSLRDMGSPAALAAEYANQGADEIMVLDITATNRERNTQLQTVTEVREEISIPLTVGGGVRSMIDVERLAAAGADRVSVNTAAVSHPPLVGNVAERFGQQFTVVAIDARRFGERWKVVTHAGDNTTELDVVEWSQQVVALGAGEILLTSFDRDGTQAGYDCELLSAVTGVVNVPVIASGGAATAADMDQAIQAGADALLAASIFHDHQLTVGDVKRELAEKGYAVRL